MNDVVGVDIGMYDLEEPAVALNAVQDEAPLELDPVHYAPQQETIVFRSHLAQQAQLAETEDQMGLLLLKKFMYIANYIQSLI